MKNYAQKLDAIFENADAFSYDKQRTESGEKKRSGFSCRGEYLKAFDKEAESYVDDMKDIVLRGGEELIRKHLIKIEKEINEKLEKANKVKPVNLPDDLTSRLRVLVKGYEVDNTLTKGESHVR